MVKETETEQKSKIAWLSEFSEASLVKSAETEIKPKLTINGLGIEFAKLVIIQSIPYLVEIPKAKAIGNNNIWMIDLEYNDVSHQFICQSGSFRFQLGVLIKKLQLTDINDLIGLPIRIWKNEANISTPTFKGKAIVYQVSMM